MHVHLTLVAHSLGIGPLRRNTNPAQIEHVNHLSTGVYITCVLVEDRYLIECWGVEMK